MDLDTQDKKVGSFSSPLHDFNLTAVVRGRCCQLPAAINQLIQ
uniref:Uncharacterized protein n=1 Tax=Populus trichocarpa TaxID=3694 RepID=A0A3N7FWZ4_POPTR